MDIDQFAREVHSGQLRLEQLKQPAEDAPWQVTQTLQELEVSYEELRVASEEIQEQHHQLTAAQNQIEAERQRYRDLFENAPDGYLVTGLDGVIIEANRAAAGLLRVQQSALVGKPLPVFVSLGERQHFRAKLRRLATTDHLIHSQLELRPPHGRSFQADLSIGRILNDHGDPVGLRWLIRDITEIIKVREEQRRYEVIVKTSQMLATRFDSDKLLAETSAMAVPAFADVCVLHLRDDTGKANRIYFTYREPSTGKRMTQVSERPLDVTSQHPAASVLRTGKRKFLPRLSEEMLALLAHTPQELAHLKAFDLKSLIALPLRARGHLLGAIIFAAGGDRSFGPQDLQTAGYLAQQIAVALDNARLFAASAATASSPASQATVDSSQAIALLETIVQMAAGMQARAETSSLPISADVQKILDLANEACRLLSASRDSSTT